VSCQFLFPETENQDPSSAAKHDESVTELMKTLISIGHQSMQRNGIQALLCSVSH
jgi:hypothetical protein